MGACEDKTCCCCCCETRTSGLLSPIRQIQTETGFDRGETITVAYPGLPPSAALRARITCVRVCTLRERAYVRHRCGGFARRGVTFLRLDCYREHNPRRIYITDKWRIHPPRTDPARSVSPVAHQCDGDQLYRQRWCDAHKRDWRAATAKSLESRVVGLFYHFRAIRLLIGLPPAEFDHWCDRGMTKSRVLRTPLFLSFSLQTTRRFRGNENESCAPAYMRVRRACVRPMNARDVWPPHGKSITPRRARAYDAMSLLSKRALGTRVKWIPRYSCRAVCEEMLSYYVQFPVCSWLMLWKYLIKNW